MCLDLWHNMGDVSMKVLPKALFMHLRGSERERVGERERVRERERERERESLLSVVFILHPCLCSLLQPLWGEVTRHSAHIPLSPAFPDLSQRLQLLCAPSLSPLKITTFCMACFSPCKTGEKCVVITWVRAQKKEKKRKQKRGDQTMAFSFIGQLIPPTPEPQDGDL